MHLPRSVLVTTVGAATGLCVLRALRRGFGDEVRLIGTDVLPSSRVAGAAFVDEFHQVLPAADPDYAHSLLAAVDRAGADFVMPIFDGEVLRVAGLRDELARRGVGSYVAEPDAIAICNSKRATAKALLDAGIPTPETTMAADVDPMVASYPVYVKPDDGVGSKSTYLVTSAPELEVFRARTPHAVVQPAVSGVEFTVEMLADRSGSVVAHVARERLETKEGVATKSRTVDLPDVVKQAADVVGLMRLAGASNVQLIGEAGSYQVIDVNPRFAAAQPLGMAAGVNLPALLLRLAAGETLEPGYHAAESGVVMLRYYEEVFVREP